MYVKKTISLLCLCLCIAASPAAAYVDTDYTLDNTGKRQEIPVTYTCRTVYRSFGGNVGFMNMPEDLFLDENGILYIADTGNDRIIRFDPATGDADAVSGQGDGALRGPKGIYADTGGDLFVADTDNHRIAHLAPDGTLVEEFVKPDSELLDPEEVFSPDKIFVSDMNRLYVKQGKQFLILDAENRFEGYAGASEVGFSFTQVLINLFASAVQKSQLENREPAQYANFLLKDGLIYAVSLAPSGQLRIISATDKNIYPEKLYGEVTLSDDGKTPVNPQFADIAVDKDGILYAIDGKSGRIYQYDAEGNLLTVCGGLGVRKGEFQSPTSLAVDDAGNLYVLDGIQNALHVFEPTAFIREVHRALSCYYNGQYAESAASWANVCRTDSGYYLANSGIGDTLYKEGRYREALGYYRTANDTAGYSRAYARLLHSLLIDYFPWVALGLAAVLTGTVCGIRALKRRTARFLARSYGFSAEERRGIR